MKAVMNKEFPVQATKRLTLRALDERDLEALLSIFSNPHTMKYYGSDVLSSLEEVEGMLMSFRKGFENQQAIRFGIECRETGQLIGTCGFHNWSKRVNRIEIGYDLKHEKEGKGYMTEALTAIISFAFRELQMNRIGALIHPENTASRKLVKNLGFQEEGLLRDYAYANENYMDLIMHSLLKKEWSNL
ncbi:GNAT family N-acetyltransferase [Guptibacillus hwajinpoensis]|uniref:GNAT family N-acetyltransferase n=1 Tax=Guptibacillus hwajinpoensis TaxID=208199 RepID=UPI0027D7C733|nr:GNAT family N-acetyltransferase [Alkalihalobacillus hemicentroti]